MLPSSEQTELEGVQESVEVQIQPPAPKAVKRSSQDGKTLLYVVAGCFIFFAILSGLTFHLHGTSIKNLRESNDGLHQLISILAENNAKLQSDLRNKSLVPAQGFATVPSDLAEYSVRIRVQNGSQGSGCGSGVLVSKNHVVTNYHVVQVALATKTVWVDFPNADGTSRAVVGVIDVVDAARDLAFIRLPEGVSAKRWAKVSAATLAPHSPILAIACGNNHLPLAKSGYFGYKMGDGRYELSINGFWGDSGGPVYDPVTGELVCLYNEMDAAHFNPATRSAIHPSIFFGIPAAWILEVMKANKIEN